MALASFGMLVVVSVVTVAGTDKWTIVLAAILGIIAFVHSRGLVTMPWWCLAVMMTAAIGRVGYLLVLMRDGLLICTAWHGACDVAARCCPTRRIRP